MKRTPITVVQALVLHVALTLCAGSLHAQSSTTPARHALTDGTTGKIYLLNTLKWPAAAIGWKIDGRIVKVKRDHYVELNVPVGDHKLACTGCGKELSISLVAETPQCFALQETLLRGFLIVPLPTESAQFELQDLKAQ